MKISLTSTNYLRENIARFTQGSRHDILFYDANDKVFASMRKNGNSDTRYYTTDIFKNGKAFIHKFVKRTVQKIYSAGATFEEDKSVVNRIITETIENNYEAGTKRTIKKVVELATPHKLMEEYPASAKIYKVEGKIKYSKPRIEEDRVEKFKSKFTPKDKNLYNKLH